MSLCVFTDSFVDRTNGRCEGTNKGCSAIPAHVFSIGSQGKLFPFNKNSIYLLLTEFDVENIRVFFGCYSPGEMITSAHNLNFCALFGLKLNFGGKIMSIWMFFFSLMFLL